MVSRALRPGALALVVLLAGCTPELDDRVFLVSGPRLLAIAATPAEAAPPAEVGFHALYVDPKGTRELGHLSWSYCVTPKGLTNQGTVSPECIATGGSALVPIGTGTSASGPLPMDGCQLFGPDIPPPVGDEPSGRPTDPDPTGGYYQPVRLLVVDEGESYSIGAARIACGVGDASQAVSTQFTQQYRNNENPALASLSLSGAAGTVVVAPDVAGAAPGATVAPGDTVTLTAAWVACPTTPVCGDGICGIDEDVTTCPKDCTHPVGCAGSEQYVWVDPSSQSVAPRREAIRVDWFATGGTLADDSSGVVESDAATHQAGNTWTAPAQAGEVRLWLVIRDDRGGVGWESYRVEVE
jgi:hypothetical protein